MKLVDHYDTVLMHDDPASAAIVPVGIQGLRFVEEVRRAVYRCKNSLLDHNPRSGGADLPMSYPASSAQRMTRQQLTQWADHILAKGSFQSRNRSEQMAYAKLSRIQALLDEYDRMITLAGFLSLYQIAFLRTRNWMEKRVLTYTSVGNRHSKWDESTCRRTIQAMRIRIGHSVLAAEELMCASELPEICKLLVMIKTEHPQAGAPKLRALLKQKGKEVSERNVGKALGVLKEWQRRQMN